MNTRSTRSFGFRTLLLPAVLGVLLAAAGSRGAEPNTSPAPANARSQSTELEYQEVPYAVARWGLSATSQTNPFRKEPALGKHAVLRGTLQLGGDATNRLAFIWDRIDGKLFLDLNGNQDLADDAGGVFGSAIKGTDNNYAEFKDVQLPLPTTFGTRPISGDLWVYYYGSRLDCTFSLRGFWQGRLALDGQDYQVGLVPRRELRTAPEAMLLRPWDARTKPFDLFSGGLDAFSFSRKLFVNDRGFQVSYTNETAGGLPKWKLTLTDLAPKLGELRLTGDFLSRVVLTGDQYEVVLDSPNASVRVPVGSYQSAKVTMKKGGAEAFRESDRRGIGKPIVINEKKPAQLVAGGPLTNSVSVDRHGKSLYLSYRLLGAGGEPYQLMQQDRSKPPEFSVHLGDKQLASGKFEFG